MPIQFNCPHCGAQTDVAEQYAGQSGPCAACGETITVPPLSGTPGYSTSKKGSSLAIALVVMLVIAMGAFLFCGVGFWFFARTRSMVARMPVPTATVAAPADSRENLRQIGMAMLMYHEAHGTFPPAYVADKDGKPMYSWRVALLPYLEHQWLYDRYRLDEPWDSPQNRALAAMMPEVYRSPDDRGGGPTRTSYLMIVGPDTISDGPTAHSIEEIQDGSSGTILVAEAASSGVNWTEPRDLDAEKMRFRVNAGSGDCIQSNDPAAAHVLLCDGAVVRLAPSTDPKQVQAMTTIAGGEAVSEIPQ